MCRWLPGLAHGNPRPGCAARNRAVNRPYTTFSWLIPERGVVRRHVSCSVNTVLLLAVERPVRLRYRMNTRRTITNVTVTGTLCLSSVLAPPRVAAQDRDVPGCSAGAAPVAAALSNGSMSAPPVLREFRGVWVATVANIDWPSAPGLATWQQQSELLAIMDRAAALHMNAIVFQVRPSADAMFPSKIEPWSAFLTGRMGRAPEPFWDPLAFAIRVAHARGLELHAWFIPFRAHDPADTAPTARAHVSKQLPALEKKYGSWGWRDPGDVRARRYVIRAIMDVVTRYDVDGVHIDDYFYPYPEPDGRGRQLEFPDANTYRAYRQNGG